jgi:hypothetical protein
VWDYFVPYQENLSAALSELQAKVLADGDYYWADDDEPGSAPAPETLDALWDHPAVQASGTHSILDVDRIIGPTDEDAFGTVRPLTTDEHLTYFGTTRPTRSDFTRAYEDEAETSVANIGQRWSGYCVVLYDEGRSPSEIVFWGYSGD